MNSAAQLSKLHTVACDSVQLNDDFSSLKVLADKIFLKAVVQ